MEKYLRKCLDSLIVSDENMQMLEVLVINDGSKDSSSQIAHGYELKYPQTYRVIDKENGNYGSCINRGLKEATGKYVKVLDADDYFDNVVFNQYISVLAFIKVDLVINNYEIVDTSDNITAKRSYEKYLKANIILSFPTFLKNKFDKRFVVQMHGIAYRTKLLREMDYSQLEGISYTDQQWSILPLTRVNSFYYFNSGSLYKYLMGREGQTMTGALTVKQPEQLFIVLQQISIFFEKQNYNPIYKAYLENRLFGQFLLFYLMGLKNNVISLEKLQSYDNSLKKYPHVYEMVGAITFYKGLIKPVKILRTGNSLERLLLLKVPRWIYSAIC